MTVITFSGNPNNTNSSPYYDYYGDTLYVGADNGTLHKFSGVVQRHTERGHRWRLAGDGERGQHALIARS